MTWAQSAAWCVRAALVGAFASVACGEATSSLPGGGAGSAPTLAGGASGSPGGLAGSAGDASGGDQAGASGLVDSAASGAPGASGAAAGDAAGASGAAAGAAGDMGASVGVNLYVNQLSGNPSCLPRPLPIVSAPTSGFTSGQAHCVLSLAAPALGQACVCDADRSLSLAPPGIAKAVVLQARVSGSCDGVSGVACSDLCVCDLEQSRGAALTQCQSDAATPTTELPAGFCYIDASQDPPLGNPALVAGCPQGSPRMLRVLGPAPVEPAPLVFLSCYGS